MKYVAAALSFLLIPLAALGQPNEESAPLLASDDLLNVKIIAPLTSIMFNRRDDKDVPGTFQFLTTDGRSVEFDIGLRTRATFVGNAKYVNLHLCE